MNGENFEPSPELQAEIDEALEKKRAKAKNPEWSAQKGIILDKATVPLQALAPDMVSIQPGQRWILPEATSVMCASAGTTAYAERSRVVLPPRRGWSRPRVATA